MPAPWGREEICHEWNRVRQCYCAGVAGKDGVGKPRTKCRVQWLSSNASSRVAAALVVPASLLRAEEAERVPDNRVADRADTATRAEVEAKAMQAVMDRERELGFEPVDVSSEDRGYDIESRDLTHSGRRHEELLAAHRDALRPRDGIV